MTSRSGQGLMPAFTIYRLSMIATPVILDSELDLGSVREADLDSFLGGFLGFEKLFGFET